MSRDLFGEPVGSSRARGEEPRARASQRDLFDAGRGDFPGQRVAFDPVAPEGDTAELAASERACDGPIEALAGVLGEAREAVAELGLVEPEDDEKWDQALYERALVEETEHVAGRAAFDLSMGALDADNVAAWQELAERGVPGKLSEQLAALHAIGIPKKRCGDRPERQCKRLGGVWIEVERWARKMAHWRAAFTAGDPPIAPEGTFLAAASKASARMDRR